MLQCIPPTSSIIFYHTLGTDSLILHIFLAVKNSHLSCYNLCDLTGKTLFPQKQQKQIEVFLTVRVATGLKYLSEPQEAVKPLPQTNGMLWKTSVSCHGSPLVQHPVVFPLFHRQRGELWYQRAIIIFQQHRYTQVQTEILITGEYFFAILERAYHDEFWLRDDHIRRGERR